MWCLLIVIVLVSPSSQVLIHHYKLSIIAICFRYGAVNTLAVKIVHVYMGNLTNYTIVKYL